MNILPRPLSMLLLCCLLLTVFWFSPQARADLIINEIMGDPNQDWDGDGEFSFRNDEWIEVKNEGMFTEDLSNYWLRDISGDDLHLQLFGNLDPGQVAVFYGSDAVVWQQEQGQGILGFSINNSGDTMELVTTFSEEKGGDLLIVHSATILDHEAENDRSSGWDPEIVQWIMNDALNPYNGGFLPQGNDCLPTPGQPNICQPLVPVQQTTWDSLKSRYR